MTYNFYDEIARNKRNSVILVSFFIILIAIGSYICALYFGGGWPIVAISFAISLTIALISYYKGDKLVLKASHAKKIQKKDNPMLYNVVEEMAVAAGLPIPNIYIIDTDAPNAFAAGRDPAHASIAVTNGLLKRLNREELQGVIAHEFSHVKHYDILFCTLIAILVGTIALMCDIIRRSFIYGGRSRRSRRSSGKGGGEGIIIIIALVFAIFAPILAQIIRFSVSRKREYLADAGGVELTRNPNGLASALNKISKSTVPLKSANRATQHLFIVNPLKPVENLRKNNVFSTHPPIQERIKRLRSMR